MKKILFILFICFPCWLHAQFVVGTQGMTIKAYATVSIDSLILSPASDITLTNNQLARSNVNQPIGTGNTINHVYTFSSPITYSGNIGFRYDDAEMAGNTESALELAYSATNAGNVWITTTGSMLNTTGNTIVQNVNNVTISRITATSNNPLPVTLIDFKANKDEKQQTAFLYWNVANELNFETYNVERSTDGKTFTQIGNVKAIAKSEYHFSDYHPETGVNYYRLQLLNTDGSYSYSPIRTLLFDKDGTQLNVYPNPVKDESITIHTTDKTLNGKSGCVTDIAGKIILSFKITGEKTLLNASNWLPGSYLIRLENGMTFKMVKQ